MDIINIKNRSDLVRDLSSGAILNTNQSEYENYINRKQKKLEQQKQLETQQALINNLKQEVDELKHLVKVLLNQGDLSKSSGKY